MPSILLAGPYRMSFHSHVDSRRSIGKVLAGPCYFGYSSTNAAEITDLVVMKMVGGRLQWDRSIDAAEIGVRV